MVSGVEDTFNGVRSGGHLQWCQEWRTPSMVSGVEDTFNGVRSGGHLQWCQK